MILFRAPLKHRSTLLSLLEAALVAWFFIQALRQLIGQLYSRTASAALASLYPVGSIPSSSVGVVDATGISSELLLLGLIIFLPLLALLFSRWRWMPFIAVAIVAGGRALLANLPIGLAPTLPLQLIVGGALLYAALLISQRAQLFPYFILLGLALDQLMRALGNTLDYTLSAEVAPFMLGLCAALLLLSFFTTLSHRSQATDSETGRNLHQGLTSLGGGVGLGALLFLQLAFLATPNAIAGRSNADYALLVPACLAATLAPLLPRVRLLAQSLVGPFESSTRGWIWLISLAMFIILGLRIPDIPLGAFVIPLGGIALVVAQLLASLAWWWFVRPRAERERNFTPLWLVVGTLLFSLFVYADLLTYEYAFIRDFAPPLDALNALVPPLLRGFRGMGLPLLLLSALLALLPMIQSTRRLAWTASRVGGSFAWLIVIAICAIPAGIAARPPQVVPVLNVSELRVGTYNLHGGYSEFYSTDLEANARAIQASGAQVVLLQEVDHGRLTSFGVDQSLWLARRLGMDRRFYATIEGLRGLAVLSRVPIVFADGTPLPSLDQQTGLQRVQIQPDDGAITLYNTQLGLLLEGDSVAAQEANQRAQLEAILRTIEAHIVNDYGGRLGRAILGGTFNNVPDSPLMQTLRATGFSDPFAGSNLALSATLVRLDARARVDYVWLWNEGLRSTGNGVIDSAASDHRLAFVGMEIRR